MSDVIDGSSEDRDSIYEPLFSEPAKTKSKALDIYDRLYVLPFAVFTGMLPPRLQEKVFSRTSNPYKAAVLASDTSRLFNAAWTIGTVASLVGKIFGADIDPTPGDIATYAGIAVGVDTVVREFAFAFKYVLDHPFNDEEGYVWGEPFLSCRDSNKHPEWYGKDKDEKWNSRLSPTQA